MREIEELNQSGNVRNSDILVTVDISSLYTNIPMNEGLEAVQSALDERVDQSFIISLLQIIFEFNSEQDGDLQSQGQRD